MAFHITIRQDKSEQVRVHGLIAVAAGKQFGGFSCFNLLAEVVVHLQYMHICVCVHLHVHLLFAYSFAPVHSKRWAHRLVPNCYGDRWWRRILCLAQVLHFCSSPKPWDSDAKKGDLEQKLGAVVWFCDDNRWPLGNPFQPKGYNVGFCNFLIGWFALFFPNVSNKLLKNILTTLVCWHPLRAPRIWWEHYLRSQIPFWCGEICWISEKLLRFTKSTNGRNSFLCVRSTADWLSCCTDLCGICNCWWGMMGHFTTLSW